MLILLGVTLLAIGVVFALLGRTGWPLGRLPGDILYRGKHATFYFPLASCLLVSLALSIVLFLIARLTR